MFRSFKIAAVVCGVCLGCVVGAKAAPVQWQSSAGGNDHFYEAVLADTPVSVTWSQDFPATYVGGITWTAAWDVATAKGGWLAHIKSAEENAFVYNLIAPTQHPAFWFAEYGWSVPLGPWLGGFQPEGSPEPGGNWQWVTGSGFTYTNWGRLTNIYQNSGMPEDALHFYNNSARWNDYPSWTVTNGYIVEYVPEPSTLVLLGIGAAGLMAWVWRRRA